MSGPSSQSVHKVSASSSSSDRSESCFNCGRAGHRYKDASCPAKGKVCRSCGRKGHFATKCRSAAKPAFSSSKKPQKTKPASRGKHVRQVECDDDSGYAFSVNDKGKNARCEVEIGGAPVNVIVDSGRDTNIVDRELWEKMKEQKIVCQSRKCERNIFPYASSVPLETVGTFTAEVKAAGKALVAEFVVIKKRGEPLLSNKTSTELGILHVGPLEDRVKAVRSDIRAEFSSVFQGLGKLKGRAIKLNIDETCYRYLFNSVI